MPDKRKTEADLLQELGLLRRRVAELERIVGALRCSEKQFRELFENTSVGVYRTTPEGRIIMANPALVHMLGYSSFQELAQRNLEKEGFALSYQRSIFKDLVEKNGKVVGLESAWLRQDGTTLFVSEHGRVVRDESEKTLYYEGIVQDITERKKAEQNLRESEEKYRQVVSTTTDAIMLFDAETRQFIEVNKACEELYGYTREEFLKLKHSDITADLEKSDKSIKKTLEGKLYKIPVRYHRKKDATVFPVEISAGTFELAGRRVLCGVVRDITERKQSEEKLKDSEATLRSIIDSATESVLLMQIDGTILAANRAAAERLGTTFGELIGKCAYDFIPDDVAESRKLQVEKVIRIGQPLIFGDVCGVRHILHSISPIKDSAGKVAKLAVFGFDMTEYKRLEVELRESELRYRSLFQSSPVGLGVATTDGKILDCNSAMLAMTGYSIAEMRQVNLKDTHVNPQARDRLLKELQTNGLVRDFQVHLKRKDGTMYWANISVIPFPFAGQDTILTAQVDITERKQAEEALETREIAIASAINPIAFADENGILTYVNEAFLKTLRYQDASQVLGKSIIEFAQNKDDAIKAMQHLLTTGNLVGEIFAVRRDGSPLQVQISASIVRGKDGRVICLMGSFIDITESKRREKELGLYRERVAQAERLASLGTLSATVAHELTQPLTTIRLSIENSLAQLETTSCPADIVEELHDGLEGVSDAVEIIDRIRNFARQSSEKAITEVKLSEVAERIVRLLDKNAQQANISVRLKDLEKLPPIYTHANDIEQLFFALADNAIRAANGKRKRQLTISGAVKGDHIELGFTDNCGGIAPENLDKIFEPFFTTRPAGEGTGLGLPIVQHIVFRSGGKVWIQNKPGKGTTFLVTLPIGKGVGS